MIKTQLAVLAVLLIGFSCKKSSTPSVETAKYMTLSSGSSWNYENTNNLTATTTLNTVTSTNRDSAINGKTYHVFTNSNGSVNDYYNITGNDYFTYKNLGAALGNINVESIYLKDNANEGVQWSQTVNVPFPGLSTPVPVTLTNTITKKGISRTVNGIAYTDVIHITTTLAVTGLPPGSLTTDIQTFYTQKYGLIESKNKISLPLLSINADQSTILKSASLK